MMLLLRRLGLAALLGIVAIVFSPTGAAAHDGHHASHRGGGTVAAAEAVPQFFASNLPTSESPHCPRGSGPAEDAGCCTHQCCPAGSAFVMVTPVMCGAVPVTPEQSCLPALHGLTARPGEHPPKRS